MLHAPDALEGPTKCSTNRIVTTHAGSLPRPDRPVRMMWDRIDEKPVDEAELEQLVSSVCRPDASLPGVTRAAG